MTTDRLQLDWTSIGDQLDAYGCAIVDLLSPDECTAQIASFEDDTLFRKHVIMEQHGYGRGEYKYFADPLPARIAQLRSTLYPGLSAIANRWNDALKSDVQFPATHAQFLERCHQAGQLKPTPLLLRYETDDFNCLHQDVYGEHVFPLQVAILLNRVGVDFEGGEFVITEQRAPEQSRAEVVPLQLGQGVIFPVRERPVPSANGFDPVLMRHGVSRLRSGRRHTLGIIFHDAA
ncbi:2OG-Fe(II) oxygenase [Blastopirellula sp. J2-11]|uniref:2OG-Fe(II) oxygenase n=1 Tax=Blastopirellula sp. J2-11 TaxID=2943192 RepID=UPI0021C5DF29|nr:2OG-Fe(II) oxygenase [Blastopirellula sp. J2-11]UUO05616.1 2OG-Fe(II) oxygenase [Blastopirellula sp. J2-11]